MPSLILEAAFTSLSALSRETSVGFSSGTCLPAAAQRSTSSRCVLGGVRTSTALMDVSSRIVSSLSHCGKRGNFSLNFNLRSALGLNAYATSTRFFRSSRLLACGATAMPRPTTATLKAIELRWIVGEDALARRFVRRPIEQQVERIGVVGRLRLARRRVRPVARPHHALRRVLHQGSCQTADILVLRCACLRRLVGCGELHPATAGINKVQQRTKFFGIG